jgi:uncharacterized membrane protein (DUF106 family)
MDQDTENASQQPDVIIPSDANMAGMPLYPTIDQFEDHKKDFNFQKRISNWTFALVVAVLVVSFISFITFIIDAYKFHYDATKEINSTIKELKKENSDLKFENLNNKIESLEKKIKKTKPTDL